MDRRFAKLVETLAPQLMDLLAMSPCSNGALPRSTPLSGIYLFSEGKAHLYVGRSNNLRQRYAHHTRPSAPHNQAVFAFLLAREKTNWLKAAYQEEGSRKWLMQQPHFCEAFLAAKVRIKSMEFRFVAQNDPTLQALLEIYAAVVLRTKYNDFANH